MSAVVGIDLSTRALDLVKLSEDSNRAEWVRCELAGGTAWERTLATREAIHQTVRCDWPETHPWHWGWWDDVYLVAIEAPYGRGQAGTTALLNRVVGAVAASLPSRLRAPERCWIVAPHEWKTGLGLPGKPSVFDTLRLSNDQVELPDDQNARDAYCLALWARDTNAEAITNQLRRTEIM